MSVDNKKIVLPIEITLTGVDELDRQLQKAQEANRLSKETKALQKDDAAFQESLDLASAQAFAEEAGFLGEDFDVGSEPGGLNRFKELLKTNPFSDSDFRNIFQLAKDPIGMLTNVIKTNLPIIAAAMIAYGLIDKLFDQLTQRGGWFDLTFKRILETEFFPGRSREMRQAIRLGQKQLIITTAGGEPFVPEKTFNSLELVRSGQIFEMDIYRIRKGATF